MVHDPYPEDDEVLAARVQLALHTSYSLAEAIKLDNRLNIMDTLDGYRVTLIKERDPQLFGKDDPVIHVSIQSNDESAIIPKTPQGWVGLSDRLLVRLGLSGVFGPVLQTQSKGRSVHVWYDMVDTRIPTETW